MRTAFGVSKFKALLLAGSFTVLASYIVRLSDSVIAGNLIGAHALAGVNLVGPCLSAVSFIANLIAIGMATNYSLAMGRCDRLRARQFFMQGVWSVLLAGGGLSLALLFGRDAFLGLFCASAEITTAARDYLAWIWPMAVVEGIEMLLVSLGYADGDARTCSLGYVVIFVGNFVISVLAVKLGFGTAGCAIGSVISGALGCLVLATHFLRASNTFAPVRHFSLHDTARIVGASFGDASAFLCDGALFFFLNRFVISHFGSEALPIVGVVTVLWGFLEFFNGVGVAIQPIVTVYYGEGNFRAVRAVMNSAMRFSLLEGLLFTVAFCLFPGAIAGVLGVHEGALAAQAAVAIRDLSIGFVALAFAGLFNSYYMFVERPALAGAVTFLSYLVMPVACVAIGSVQGLGGVWTGLGVGPFAGLLTTAFVVIATAGRASFPLLLDRAREAKQHLFNLRLIESEIVAASRQIAALPGVPMKAALLVEEVFMTVRDRACGKTLLGEATVDLSDGVRLTLRDDGEIFDITDADQRISSLRTYLVASVMATQPGRRNLVTTGFNRNVFKL